MILTYAGFAAIAELRDSVSCWLRIVLGIPSPAEQSFLKVASQRQTFGIQASPLESAMYFSAPADQASEYAAALSPSEQRARVIALRGMSQAREGNFSAAEETFAEAVMLDPKLDLRRLPLFWQLPRQIHEAAIGALLTAGRTRDASALIADLKTRFRPRLLPQSEEE